MMSFRVKIGIIVYLNYSTLSFALASIQLSLVLEIFQIQYFQKGKIILDISSLPSHFKLYLVKTGDPYELFKLFSKANCSHEILGFN